LPNRSCSAEPLTSDTGTGTSAILFLTNRSSFAKGHLQDIGGPAWTHSGNAGVLDLVAALHWVRDNIERLAAIPAT
jgi:para-nitrobenzyl esterase